MCTALTFKTKNLYFGRNFDYHISYKEKIIITPRNYAFVFSQKEYKTHFSFIGMGIIYHDYPLYYDGVNEKGLCIAGLNFKNNAKYSKKDKMHKINLKVHEFIPFILATCASIKEVKDIIKNINLLDLSFTNLEVATLHYLISDKDETITVEPINNKLLIYENKYGVLTNNPPYLSMIKKVKKYETLTNKEINISNIRKLKSKSYSSGEGAKGLPGDLTSSSRFIRTIFNKEHALKAEDEVFSYSQVFHILDNVSFIKGCCFNKDNLPMMTIYQSVINVNEKTYYFKTYLNSNIQSINLFSEDLASDKLIAYSTINQDNIKL